MIIILISRRMIFYFLNHLNNCLPWLIQSPFRLTFEKSVIRKVTRIWASSKLDQLHLRNPVNLQNMSTLVVGQFLSRTSNNFFLRSIFLIVL